MYLGFTDLKHSNGKKYKYSTDFTGFTDFQHSSESTSMLCWPQFKT